MPAVTPPAASLRTGDPSSQRQACVFLVCPAGVSASPSLTLCNTVSVTTSPLFMKYSADVNGVPGSVPGPRRATGATPGCEELTSTSEMWKVISSMVGNHSVHTGSGGPGVGSRKEQEYVFLTTSSCASGVLGCEDGAGGCEEEAGCPRSLFPSLPLILIFKK